MHAIILVGGRGTRLQPLTDTRPKPMLPILDRPFLEHQLRLSRAPRRDGCHVRVRLPARSRSAATSGTTRASALELTYAIEPEPLDTAGAIAFAARDARARRPSTARVQRRRADRPRREPSSSPSTTRATRSATIALTPVEDPTRYGLVRTGDDDEVLAFVEKPTARGSGRRPTYINAGTYVLEPEVYRAGARGRARQHRARGVPGARRTRPVRRRLRRLLERHRHLRVVPRRERGRRWRGASPASRCGATGDSGPQRKPRSRPARPRRRQRGRDRRGRQRGRIVLASVGARARAASARTRRSTARSSARTRSSGPVRDRPAGAVVAPGEVIRRGRAVTTLRMTQGSP